jgi:fatty-acid peroxygenase
MMTPPALQRMVEQFRAAWLAAVPLWGERQIVLQDEVSAMLALAAAAWAGMPLDPEQAPQLTRQLVAMIEQTGTIGPANWWAHHLRNQAERYWQDRIRSIRSGETAVPEGSAADLIARHRDLDGELLDETIAAVELLNVLRPTVAVARFVTFAALALHHHPQWRETFAGDGEELLRPFGHEVRRFYPFFPVIGGRARYDFAWQGHAFSKGDWVLLDLYGTNHDARLWPEPEAFQPERFVGWPGDPNTLIPQGAGDYATGHRCPGEWLTIALLEEAVRLLTRTVRYKVPAQDLTVALDQLPALPKSGFILQKTQLLAA